MLRSPWQKMPTFSVVPRGVCGGNFFFCLSIRVLHSLVLGKHYAIISEVKGTRYILGSYVTCFASNTDLAKLNFSSNMTKFYFLTRPFFFILVILAILAFFFFTPSSVFQNKTLEEQKRIVQSNFSYWSTSALEVGWMETSLSIPLQVL